MSACLLSKCNLFSRSFLCSGHLCRCNTTLVCSSWRGICSFSVVEQLCRSCLFGFSSIKDRFTRCEAVNNPCSQAINPSLSSFPLTQFIASSQTDHVIVICFSFSKLDPYPSSPKASSNHSFENQVVNSCN